MKKIMILTVATLLFTGNVSVFAGRGYESQESGYFYAGTKSGEGRDVRTKRMRRDLDKEYSEGSLTKTEYIQRLRELKALNK
jgi:hypothetical protein